MASSDEEVELVPHSVANYYFVDANEEPISFAALPVSFVDDCERKPKQHVFLHGTGDGGLQKVYKQVTAWKLVLENVKAPEIMVLTKDKKWVQLLNPRRSYLDIARTVLVTIHALHFLRRKPQSSAKNLWDHVRVAVRGFENWRLSAEDFKDHRQLVRLAMARDVALARSQLLQGLLKKRKMWSTVRKEDMRDEVDKSEENLDLYDTVCAICDNGGRLICCEGRCMRSFHATKEDGEDSKCTSLGFKTQIENFQSFVCKNCKYKQHQCFACGKLGSSDKAGAVEVFPCANATCGHFYHPKCVADLLFHKNKMEAAVYEKKIALGVSFTCPVHRCHACKQGENWRVKELQFAVCRRCPMVYHRKCLPRKISLGGVEEEGILQRAWEGLLPNRILIYCLKHEIDPDLVTPVRNHLTFPETTEKKKNMLISYYKESSLRKTKGSIQLDCQKSLKAKGYPKITVESEKEHEIEQDLVTTIRYQSKSQEILEKKKNVHVSDSEGHRIGGLHKIKRFVPLASMKSPKEKANFDIPVAKTKKHVIQHNTGIPESKKYKRVSDSKEPVTHKCEESVPLYNKESLKRKADTEVTDEKEKSPEIEEGPGTPIRNNNTLPEIHIRKKNRRVSDIKEPSYNECEGSVPLDIVKSLGRKADDGIPVEIEKITSLIEEESSVPTLGSTLSSIRNINKNITLDTFKDCSEVIKADLRILEDGSTVVEAKAVCPPDDINQLLRWNEKFKAYPATSLPGMPYTSFGRHFSEADKLQEIVNKLQCYVQTGDTIVDFCCGTNDFSRLMKEDLDAAGENCSYRNYDVVQPKDDFCFERRDWMTIEPKELPTGSKLIIGLNPPFGADATLANKFIDKALTFKPKLLVLIVPKEAQRLDEKQTPYDLIWEDSELLARKPSRPSGSDDADGTQNFSPPSVYLWSRPDWTKNHKGIALRRGHESKMHQTPPAQEEGSDYETISVQCKKGEPLENDDSERICKTISKMTDSDPLMHQTPPAQEEGSDKETISEQCKEREPLENDCSERIRETIAKRTDSDPMMQQADPGVLQGDGDPMPATLESLGFAPGPWRPSPGNDSCGWLED